MTARFFRYATATLLCLLFLSGSAFAAGKVLVNGIDANFPPFASIDKTGKAVGFDVDVMNLIAKDQGFEVKHQPIDWDAIIPNLLAKKIDMVASGMSITEERAKQVNFSSPYYEIKQVLVIKKGSKLTLNDVLTGKKNLGAQQGTSEAKWLQEEAIKNKWNFTLKLYTSGPLACEDVLNGRIDAAAMDNTLAQDVARNKPVMILGTFGMKEELFGYATRKEDKELLAKINAGLKKLMASPTWNELKKKHQLN